MQTKLQDIFEENSRIVKIIHFYFKNRGKSILNAETYLILSKGIMQIAIRYRI